VWREWLRKNHSASASATKKKAPSTTLKATASRCDEPRSRSGGRDK
jgi:hypothetical protein